jgi:hypothetical protein
MRMNAEIIAVGSELLTPARLDTNSLFLTGKLNGLGVEVVGKMVVGDDAARLAARGGGVRAAGVGAVGVHESSRNYRKIEARKGARRVTLVKAAGRLSPPTSA